MRPVLVGSRALAFWLPDFKCREDADWDFIWTGTGDYSLNLIKGRTEVHYGTDLNNKNIVDNWTCWDEAHPQYYVMSLEGLALLKRSHLHRDHFFNKHITMYHHHLSKYALWDDPVWVELLNERIKLTKKAYPQRNPSLKQSNDDFFDDFVGKEFEHDWLHELVAYYDRPLFERLKKPENTESAWCEGDLWEEFSHEDKCRCVAEETHVIACERFMVPSGWKHYQKLAYFKALHKVCTTLTSGWFRDWAIDNYPEIVTLYDPSKFDKVRKETTS